MRFVSDGGAMAEAIYLLSALTSLVAGGLLLRYYLTRRTPLLLWSCIGFLGLVSHFRLSHAVRLTLVREVLGKRRSDAFTMHFRRFL